MRRILFPPFLLLCILLNALHPSAFSTTVQRATAGPNGQSAAQSIPTEGVWMPPSQNTSKRKGRVFTIDAPEDLLQFVAEDDRLCVIKVYASWCATCKKFDARYRKAVNQFRDGGVRFAEMRYDNNAGNEELCRDVLGISTFPYILMYKGGKGKVEGFHCTPAKYPQLVDKIKLHLGGGGEDGTTTKRHAQQQLNHFNGDVKYGIYDGKLWDHAAKKDVYDQWDPMQPRSALNFDPFEAYKGNSSDASGYYPGEPRYKEPVSGDVSYDEMRAEEAHAKEREANPKSGSGKGCPGCKN